MIKVAIAGALGKMGKEVVKLVNNSTNLELAVAIDKFYNLNDKHDYSVDNDIEHALKNYDIDVVVDFTQPSTVYQNIQLYLNNKTKAVIGTTGLTKEQIENIEKLSRQNNTGIIIAPNFSIGAILMMEFAARASKYFSNAEIIEFHHNQKKDAPSGTAIKTAQLMIKSNNNFKDGNCEEFESIKGARGAEFIEENKGKIQIHAVRMPGFVASQEVIFGADGQTLKIHHDTINRECYMGGVKLAVEHVDKNNQFIYGLENII